MKEMMDRELGLLAGLPESDLCPYRWAWTKVDGLKAEAPAIRQAVMQARAKARNGRKKETEADADAWVAEVYLAEQERVALFLPLCAKRLKAMEAEVETTRKERDIAWQAVLANDEEKRGEQDGERRSLLSGELQGLKREHTKVKKRLGEEKAAIEELKKYRHRKYLLGVAALDEPEKVALHFARAAQKWARAQLL